MKPVKLKSLEEVLTRFRELVHRHRRRFLKRHLQPCPYNCKKAVLDRKGEVVGCARCGSRNPEFCKKPSLFLPLYTKEELYEQFRQALRDPKTLLKDYRDLVVFLWVTGQFDDYDEVPEHFIQKMEDHK
jgi:hypothetical protein